MGLLETEGVSEMLAVTLGVGLLELVMLGEPEKLGLCVLVVDDVKLGEDV